ncbi:single-stranded DNA-binding protein [Butyrivibrio sp. AE2005]|uniref:single-stranded DNA-binding protein n=1 Tax=Butyrivibrio sp. AE2005 TaxID=1496722 RepID=UPI00068F33B8|nr:single-stranded DNA-binding protein [Butyrivibrio sp. AE2005]
MNKVILAGRLTRDAEIRNASSDKKVARCTLAVNRTYKREDDEQSADFINLVSFKNQADFLEKYGKKGTKFIVTGRIQTGSYEKDGTRIFTTDVIVEQLEFAESKNSSGIEAEEEYAEVPEGFEGLPFK